jgi:iron complex transport system ATP-binding protein
MSAAITFAGVRVRYGNGDILKGVGAEIAAGQLTGIVGPNGAGKTTLLRAALRLVPLVAGEIRILDKPLAAWSRESLARVCAYLPQGGETRWPMYAADVAMLGRLPHLQGLAAPSPADAAAVDAALERCDAVHFAVRRMDELSAGERARVLLARALATRADILLADEPAAFLDPAHQIRLMEILHEEACRGAAVVVTLHDLPLAARHCDRLIVLGEGLAAASGTPEEALSDEVLARFFSIAAWRVPGPDGSSALAAFRRI